MDKEVTKVYILLCDEDNTKTRVLLYCTRKYASYRECTVRAFSVSFQFSISSQ